MTSVQTLPHSVGQGLLGTLSRELPPLLDAVFSCGADPLAGIRDPLTTL